MDNRKEESKKLRDMGLDLTPLRNGNRPYLSKWNIRAYTEEDWDRFHGLTGSNFGLILGGRSFKVVCLDADPRNGSQVWMDEHPQIWDDCAIIEKSGRGEGHHFFFMDIDGTFQKSCLLAPGMDYLAHGKQVALAPSLHKLTGNPNTKVKGDLLNFFMEITAIPDWLKEELDKAGAAKKRAGDQSKFELSGTMTDEDEKLLLHQLSVLEPNNGSRHDTIASWVTDAVGSLMPDAMVQERAEGWMAQQGRAPNSVREIPDWIAYAKKGFAEGTSYISSNLLNVERYLDTEEQGTGGFTPVLTDDQEDPNATGVWEGHMVHSWDKTLKKNVFKKKLYNIQVMLEMHPDLKGRIALNEMFNMPIKYGPDPFPWDDPSVRYTHNSMLDERDYARIHAWFSKCAYRWETKDCELVKAVLNAAGNRLIHPTRDWLYGLRWDGTPRLTSWLAEITRCDDSKYHQLVGRKLILSITARIIQPGIKYDDCVIFEGPQGCGKSTLCEALAGGDEYFIDNIDELKDSRQTVERTLGKTVVELQEIDKLFNRFSASVLKTWLSTRKEVCRLAYARQAGTNFRSFVAIGTTNKATYLVDTSGERRYFPVKTGSKFFKIEEFNGMRDQLFAEAVELIKEKGIVHILKDSPELYKLQSEVNAKRTLIDPWANSIIEYLNSLTDNREFYIQDILDVKFMISEGKQTLKDVSRVKRLVTQLGCFEVKDAGLEKLRHWIAPMELNQI